MNQTDYRYEKECTRCNQVVRREGVMMACDCEERYCPQGVPGLWEEYPKSWVDCDWKQKEQDD